MLWPTLCDPRDCSTSGFNLPHHLPEFAQVHVHWIGDSIQPSHPLSPASPPTLSLSQHQGHCQWVSSSHQVAKVLELQHQSFQCPFREWCLTWPHLIARAKVTTGEEVEIKRRLLLGRKVMTNLDSILKRRDITLLTKVCLVKAIAFPVVMYGCESQTIKKAESQRIDTFKL